MSCIVRPEESSRRRTPTPLPIQKLFDDVDERLHKLYNRYLAIKSAGNSARGEGGDGSRAALQASKECPEKPREFLFEKSKNLTGNMDLRLPSPKLNPVENHRSIWPPEDDDSGDCWSVVSKHSDEVENVMTEERLEFEKPPKIPSYIQRIQLEGISDESNSDPAKKENIPVQKEKNPEASVIVEAKEDPTRVLLEDLPKEKTKMFIVDAGPVSESGSGYEGNFVGIIPAHFQQKIVRPSNGPSLQDLFLSNRPDFVARSENRLEQIKARRSLRIKLEDAVLPKRTLRFAKRDPQPEVMHNNAISLKTARNETARRIRKIAPPKKTAEMILAERRSRRQRQIFYSRIVQNRNHNLYSERACSCGR